MRRGWVAILALVGVGLMIVHWWLAVVLGGLLALLVCWVVVAARREPAWLADPERLRAVNERRMAVGWDPIKRS